MFKTIAGVGWRQWLRPPRHLVVLFLVTTLGFLAGLSWLGWRSLQSAEEGDFKRVRDHLESATDAVASDLRRNLADIEAHVDRFSALPAGSMSQAIAPFTPRLGPDALIVVIDSRSIQAFPPRRLLYYPIVAAAEDPYVNPVALLRRGTSETSDSALEYFQQLAQADDDRARAEGLLGLARVQATTGRARAALATYSKLQQPDVLVEGRPAELLARLARCGLLSELGSPAELKDEIRGLNRDLQAGRWQLTRASYLHYTAEVRRLIEASGLQAEERRPSPVALALATGIDSLWKLWQEQGLTAETAAGRASQVSQGQSIFILWRATNDRFVALVAGPEFVQRAIVDPSRGVLDRQAVRVFLTDGHQMVSGGPGPAEAPRAVRTSDVTGLPWTLSVISANTDIDRSESRTRRQLVIAGLAFLALFVMVGSYLSVRAVVREFEAARLKSDFVAAVSHEFRTPLTLLRQFSDLLADDRVSSDEERRRYYRALQRGTRRLTRLVEDLLDFGRMEAGSRAFKVERIVARTWMTGITGEFQEEMRSRGYELEVSWTGAPAVVKAEGEALGRALWNLLDNAVKYSPNCKTIWVAGGFENQRLTVTVRDRGVGIPATEQDMIFRKFVRGSALGSHVVKGTGLGLSLVKQIIEAHGGTVHVESIPGEGSTFSIVLPAESESAVDAVDPEQAQCHAS